jgi:hypothetical protein
MGNQIGVQKTGGNTPPIGERPHLYLMFEQTTWLGGAYRFTRSFFFKVQYSVDG